MSGPNPVKPGEVNMKLHNFLTPMWIMAGLIGTQVNAQTDVAAAEKGKAAYVQNGCWQCHGFLGQGGVAGVKLAPDPKPIEFYSVFVRYSNGPMPPYTEKVLPNEELASIHAYLKSIPKGPDYKSIPLLNN
jgi:ubiquinol-cytochrome c reductase cytochrome c subunit